MSFDIDAEYEVDVKIYHGVVSMAMTYWNDFDVLDGIHINDTFNEDADLHHRSFWAGILERRSGIYFMEV